MSKLSKVILEKEAVEEFNRYSDYVVKHRMIPNLLDNKTDIQRRCIFISKREGLLHNVKRRKLATIVGSTMAVHPHGDAGITSAYYTLGQWWKQNLKYMDIEGNVGTPFGDTYAAPRYCCTGDTIVHDRIRGLISINDIIKLSGNVSDVKGYIDISHLNIEVKGVNGKWVKSNKIVDSDYHDVHKLILKNGMMLKCTDNHPVLTIINIPGHEFKIEWKKLSELNIDKDVVVVNRDTDNINHMNKYKFSTYHDVSKIDSIIEKVDYDKVYSLVIESTDHAYITNGIVSHNTEARLSKYGEFMFTQDLNKDVVPFTSNYDDTILEPALLPAVLPDILINGNFGIATGFTASFLPHNINDVIDTCKAYVQNRKIKPEELVNILKAPDFPLGGTIVGTDGIKDAYLNGSGRCIQRGKWEKVIENKECYILVTTIPYNSTTEDFINGIKKLAQKADEGKIVFNITGYEDHSNMEGIRIKLKLDSEDNYDAMVSLLLSDTSLEIKHNMIHNVIHNGQLITNVSLYDIISKFIEFRETCLYNKFKMELFDVKSRLHILEAVMTISKDKISNIEKLIKEIRTSKNKEDAIKKVITMYKFSRNQAEYIVNLRLYKLSSLELDDYTKEYNNLTKRKKELENLTATKQNKYIDKYMIDQWEEFRSIFGYKRKTNIIAKDTLNKVASLIPCTVWLTGYNMIIGAKYKGDIKIESHTQNNIYLLTQRGYLYSIKVPKIMKNPNIDIRKIINLRGDDPIIGVFSNKTNNDIDIIIQGESKFKRYRIQNGFTLGSNGKRIFTGDIVTGVIEKYSGNLVLSNDKHSINKKVEEYEFDTDYSYFCLKVTGKKGLFVIK